MERRRLGRSGLYVSSICMGTMTFGSQCNEREAFRILDYAYDAGIDFYDAAEAYPVPPRAETVGLTEEYFGRWAKTKPRESIIVATKITGAGHGWFQPPVRFGKTFLDRFQIVRSVEGSLKRMGLDYIDLYQIHWPDHGMPYEEILVASDDLIKAGKIRVIGCSNETCWGLMKSLWAAEKHSLPRYQTVQNNFSLINRRCESELAQVCRREGVSLLPYSPLGGGVLSGKYNNGLPRGARFTDYLNGTGERQRRMAQRFVNARTIEVAKRASQIAEGIGVTLVALALAWSKQHDFVASTIVGATTVQQLQESLAGSDLILTSETLERLDQIDFDIPNAMHEDGLRRL